MSSSELERCVTGAVAGAVYVFSWVVGWIVRGFRGIPRGMDAKPAPAEDLYARVQARAAELRAEGFDPGEAGTMAAMKVLGGRKP